MGSEVTIVIRWWFGLTYLVAGVGCVLAGPVMIARGEYGGAYMFIGGPLLVGLGCAIHPWNAQRAKDALRRLAFGWSEDA